MKLLMTLALSVLLLGNAFAQSTKGQSPTPAERAAHATERMTKQLELNAQHKKKGNVVEGGFRRNFKLNDEVEWRTRLLGHEFCC